MNRQTHAENIVTSFPSTQTLPPWIITGPGILPSILVFGAATLPHLLPNAILAKIQNLGIAYAAGSCSSRDLDQQTAKHAYLVTYNKIRKRRRRSSSVPGVCVCAHLSMSARLVYANSASKRACIFPTCSGTFARAASPSLTLIAVNELMTGCFRCSRDGSRQSIVDSGNGHRQSGVLCWLAAGEARRTESTPMKHGAPFVILPHSSVPALNLPPVPPSPSSEIHA